MFNQSIETQNEQVQLPFLKEKNIELWIKREDTIHEFVSGNKFRKLRYNILEAQKQGKTTLLTFGGAYSNHIVATAVAGNLAGFKTIGIVRGEELALKLNTVLKENKTLKEAHRNGMHFEFISRDLYSKKHTEEFIKNLREKYGDFYLIPEGGTNPLAIKGCEEVLSEKDEKFDYICVAVGTGGTIAGIINSIRNKVTNVLGFPALKGDFLQEPIEELVNKKTNWTLVTDYHFGGYAKVNSELITFINEFKAHNNIQLDPIYTGKMIFGVLDLIKKNEIKEGAKILAIHTGGLQGIEGINTKLKNKSLALIKV